MQKLLIILFVLLFSTPAFSGSWCTKNNWEKRQKTSKQVKDNIEKLNQEYDELTMGESYEYQFIYDDLSSGQLKDKYLYYYNNMNRIHSLGEDYKENVLEPYQRLVVRWDKMADYCKSEGSDSNSKKANDNARLFEKKILKVENKIEKIRVTNNAVYWLTERLREQIEKKEREEGATRL